MHRLRPWRLLILAGKLLVRQHSGPLLALCGGLLLAGFRLLEAFALQQLQALLPARLLQVVVAVDRPARRLGLLEFFLLVLVAVLALEIGRLLELLRRTGA